MSGDPIVLMNRFLLPFFLCMLLTAISLRQQALAQVTTGSSERVFTREQILTDIQFLEQELLRKHPGLFTYSDSISFFQFGEWLRNSIPSQMHEREIYVAVSGYSQIIRDGHTLFFPAPITTSSYNSFELFFPFRVCWDGEKLFSVMHFTDSVFIPDGAQILSINGVAASDIIQFCMDHMMHDGFNNTYAIWVLNNWFSEYYGYFFGHPATHHITFLDEKGLIKDASVEGVPKPEIQAVRPLRYPKNDLDKQEGEGINLEFTPNQDIAILRIRDFNNNTLRNTYDQNFRPAIYHAFAEIEEIGCRKLIVDLRDNQGGEVRNGLILLRFLLCERFKMVNHYEKVYDPYASAHERLRRKLGGAFTGWRNPVQRNHYDGELVVLVNGGSFSNSAIVTAALRHQQRGILVGEETGGNGVRICGSVREIKLPNSGIIVEIPTLQFVINQEAENTGRGILPDVVIRTTVIDKLTGKDPEMDAAFQLLQDAD